MEFQQAIIWIEIGFELAGVAVLVIGTLIALSSLVAAMIHCRTGPAAYSRLRQSIGRAILLGLELLVAADIIRSVALEPSFESVGVLGLIVIIRTFLSWSLEVEITGVWPWQQSRLRSSSASPEDLSRLE